MKKIALVTFLFLMFMEGAYSQPISPQNTLYNIRYHHDLLYTRIVLHMDASPFYRVDSFPHSKSMVISLSEVVLSKKLLEYPTSLPLIQEERDRKERGGQLSLLEKIEVKQLASDTVTILMTFSNPSQYKTLILQNPARLIIDVTPILEELPPLGEKAITPFPHIVPTTPPMNEPSNSQTVSVPTENLLPAEKNQTALSKAFSTKFQILNYVTQMELADQNIFNPNNRLIQFPKAQLDIDLRPTFRLQSHAISLLVKPQLIVNTKWPTQSLGEASKTDNDAFINEWHAQWEFSPSLIGVYGREVLLWGPSYLFSPSNPFFDENGQSNPKRELRGKDFLRVISIPNSSWAFSFISNREDDSKLAHMLKIDYTGQSYALGLNLSKSEGHRLRFGDYGQVTVSDAMLLYTEGSLSHGTKALYPRQTATPVGWEMAGIKKQTDRYFFTELVGGSYTLGNGMTLSVEYVHNQEGYSDAEAKQYDQLGREVSEIFLAQDERLALAASVLGSASSPGLRLLRRNYLFFQVLQTDIHNKIDLTLRYTHNLDDQSWVLVPVIEWNQNDWIQIFALGTVQGGHPTTEFGRFIKYQAVVGTKLFIW
ncbi:MAG: hypothetical protein AAB317_04045 [Nitrospirota bacterium]